MAAPAFKLRPSEPDPLLDLTDEQRTEAGRRLAIVMAWRNIRRDFLAAGRTAADALKVCLVSREGLTRATLYRWDGRYTDQGIMGLVDHRTTRDGDGGGTDCSPEAWSRFKALYLTIHRRSVALCHQIVAHEAAEHGWQWPSLRTIQRKVKLELPPVHADYFRQGEREWMRRFGPKLRRDYDQYRAGECWVADFHPLDVFCRRSDTDPTIVRPLLSAFMDMRSRVIVGHLVTESENQETVLAAFRNGVRDHGCPWSVIVDNGKPYRARGVSGGRPGRRIADEDYVRSVFGSLSIAVTFSLPYNPDSKPIERFFSTLESQFCCLFETYCGGEKDDRFKAAHKLSVDHPERCPTVAELADRLTPWLAAYHATPHRGEGLDHLSPSAAFERFDPIPVARAPEGVMDLLLMRSTRPVKVTRFGVRHNGVDYANFDRLHSLQGQEVMLRIPPESAGYVVVCDLEGRPICRATNPRLTAHDVDHDHVAAGMRKRKAARTLARKVRDGATRAALDDAVTAAIKARHAAGDKALDRILAATGTDDDVPARGVRALRGDLGEAVAALNRQIDRPSNPDGFSFDDLANALDAAPPAAAPNLEDLLDL